MAEAVDKSKDVLDRLMTGIKETMNGENFRNFLKVQSQFHNYSFNNAMLIYMQNPNATRVAGFETWKKLGRFVQKGEKGIQIIRPEKYDFTKDVPDIDKITKKPVIDPVTGKEKLVPQKITGIRFVPAYVFDVSQTAGKELPEICRLLQGENINSDMIIRGIQQVSEIPIRFQEIDGSARGYYQRGHDEHIAIKSDMSLDQSAKTLIHEFAHSKLHKDEPFSSMERALKEFEAESVAFIVSDRFGVDTSEYSFDYLASWTKNMTPDDLKGQFKRIQETADTIINNIEETLNRELEMPYSPVKVVVTYSEDNFIKPGTLYNFEDLREFLHQETLIRDEKLTNGEEYYNPKCRMELRFEDGTKLSFQYHVQSEVFKDLKEKLLHEHKIDIDKFMDVKVPTNPFDTPLPHPFKENDAFENALNIRTDFIMEQLKDADVIKFGNDVNSDFVIMHPKTNLDSGYQLTYFVDEQPFSHAWFDDLKEVADRLVDTGFGYPLEKIPYPEVGGPEAIQEMVQSNEYNWDGMKKIDLNTAIELWNSNSSDIYLLRNDNTEASVSEIEELTDHVEKGGELGIDSIKGYSRYIDHLSPEEQAELNAGWELIHDLDSRVSVDGAEAMDIKEVESLLNGDSTPLKDTLVVNAFAGPGAGKTTSALALVSELKKMGVDAEYISEYAKELVYDGKFDLLDGKIENENHIYSEKMNRIERLMGKVDVIVTDSSLIQSIQFLDDKKCSPADIEQFSQKALADFDKMKNFNYFVERGPYYQTEGRIHSLEQSMEIDFKIKDFLTENKIQFLPTAHDQVQDLPVIVKSIVDDIKHGAIRDDLMKHFKEQETILIDYKPSNLPLNEILNDFAVGKYVQEELSKLPGELQKNEQLANLIYDKTYLEAEIFQIKDEIDCIGKGETPGERQPLDQNVKSDFMKMKEQLKECNFKLEWTNNTINGLVKSVRPSNETPITTAKETVTNLYKDKFPAIQHVSEKTAKTILKFNETQGKTISINTIKKTVKDIGKQIESGDATKILKKTFDNLSKAVDDLKDAQVKEKAQMVKESQDALKTTKNMDLELS